MTTVLENIGRSKLQIGLFLLALMVRVGFLYFGTPFYFGEAGIQVLSDTYWWSRATQNLVDFGVYSSNMDMPNGLFYRPPGYSLFLLPLYLVFDNWETVFHSIVWIQIIADSFVAVIFFKIIYLVTKNKLASTLAGLLYSFYVFSLGWTAVTYPETFSVFFLVSGLYFLLKYFDSNNKVAVIFFSGALLGIAALMRIQLLILLPIPVFILLYKASAPFGSSSLRAVFAFSMGVLLTYGLWPARNLINHDQLVLAQKLDDHGHWAYDFMAFRSFVWSVKTDIEPEITYLMAGEEITWPKEARLSAEEELRAKEAINLMNECGSGLYAWRSNNGYAELNSQIEEDCNAEIAEIWNELIDNQKRNNSFHYYISVPLGNLKKALFKSSLVKQEFSWSVFLVFGGRSILLILGILSLIILQMIGPTDIRKLLLFIGSAFIIEYVFFSFFLRSMEMRYLLQVDSILLLPSAILLSRWVR
jgi:4-amino-4-deoxy-L-arabinose transferase-like glycosyltransferase